MAQLISSGHSRGSGNREESPAPLEFTLAPAEDRSRGQGRTDVTLPVNALDNRQSWIFAFLAFGVISLAFGSPYVSVVALKQMALEIGEGARSAPSLANALATLGAALGGMAFGWLTDRIGIFWPLLIGGVMIGVGCAISILGGEWALYIGHGAFIGFLGTGAIYAPLVTTVSRWFDRRRGLALSLVASGQQVAGALWPPLFGVTIEHFGWRMTLLVFGLANTAIILPLAFTLRAPAPEPEQDVGRSGIKAHYLEAVPAQVVFGILCIAIVGCCVAMAMPMTHLVAFCSDLGYGTVRGTQMLALLLGCAFLSRLLWGRLSDEIGGLLTVLLGTICQAVLLAAFMFVENLYALYLVSAAFGLGFGGIIPSYILAVRELFAAEQAGWRIATILFFSLAGMALGSWAGGYIFDRTLDYRWAFAAGVGFDLFTVLLIAGLLLAPSLRRQTSSPD
jgi:MFS family permease